jgi:hypothetical protein
MRQAGRYITTCAVVAASGFNEVSEFSYLSSQSISLVSGDEYQLVILYSVDDGVCCDYGEGSAVRYCDP